MYNSNCEYTFLINGKEKLVIKDYSLYSAKKRAKRIVGSGTDIELIGTKNGFKKRKENGND